MSSRKGSSARAGESGLPPLVLLVGEAAALRDAALAEIRRLALGDAPPEFNEDRFDFATRGTEPAAVIAAARTLPVMAPQRLVIVRGLSERRARPFLEERLQGYLEEPVPTTCLVLVAERVDRRLRWVKAVSRAGELRDLAPPTRPADVVAWIEERLRADPAKRPERGTARALYDAVGPDLDRLVGELAKLALYTAGREEIGVDDVAAVTADLRPRALYELSDAIGQRRIALALQVLQHLLDQGEAPLRVLAALANHFRRLLRASECQPLQAREVQRRLGIHPFAARKVAEQARAFGPRRLRSCLAAVRHTDDALKGAIPLAPRLAIERLVLAVCS
ncbi:MAG: DNA polymerase III subunit delta [Myxococcota bacterium]